jgi:hypothetical protein
MKTCGTCKIEKSTSEFYKNKTKPDGLSSYCKDCKRIYNKTHYDERGHLWKQTRHEQALANKKKSQDFVCEYLSSHPCVDCGEAELVVLEFDHIQDKEFNISKKMSCGIDTLRREINKCEVRCANCHRRKTAERMGGNYKTKYLGS